MYPQKLRERAINYALSLISEPIDLLRDIIAMMHHSKIRDINDMCNLLHTFLEELKYGIIIKYTNKYTKLH